MKNIRVAAVAISILLVSANYAYAADVAQSSVDFYLDCIKGEKVFDGNPELKKEAEALCKASAKQAEVNNILANQQPAAVITVQQPPAPVAPEKSEWQKQIDRDLNPVKTVCHRVNVSGDVECESR